MVWKGIIFDLDGVICSTDNYHYLAWKQISDRLGIRFDKAVNQRLHGVSRLESLEIILEQYDGEKLSAAEKHLLTEEKNAIYCGFLESIDKSFLEPEVEETLYKLRDKELHLMIGSSSKNASFIIERLGISHIFEAVIDGNQIKYSKPHPEVFQKAAASLKLQPEQCLVVEDACAGVEAAKAAGMKVACLGPASQKGMGDYNLHSFAALFDIL